MFSYFARSFAFFCHKASGDGDGDGTKLTSLSSAKLFLYAEHACSSKSPSIRSQTAAQVLTGGEE